MVLSDLNVKRKKDANEMKDVNKKLLLFFISLAWMFIAIFLFEYIQHFLNYNPTDFMNIIITLVAVLPSVYFGYEFIDYVKEKKNN